MVWGTEDEVFFRGRFFEGARGEGAFRGNFRGNIRESLGGVLGGVFGVKNWGGFGELLGG